MRYLRIRTPSLSIALSGVALLAGLLAAGYVERPTTLQQVLKGGELVVVTRNSPTTYYEGPMGPTGLEYDLASRFANFLGVELKVIVAPSFGEILPMITRREAHLAAAGLTVTEARQRWVRFGPVYQEISQQLVYRFGDQAPSDTLEALSHGMVEVVAGSSHVEQLIRLTSHAPHLTWRANASADIHDLLANVWLKKINYTIADSNDILINQRYYPELRVAFDITDPEPLAWAFPRGADDSLYREAVRFFDTLRANGQLQRLIERHYSHVEDFDYVGTRAFLRDTEERLPEYLPQFEAAARKYGQDWRLLAAIGYQESHWDPKAISPTGVRGIMMLTRQTAADMGIRNRIDPQNSIFGGARYFRRLKKRIPETIPEPDRTWMALAAYNIGYGHLDDARDLTRQRGGDPNNWMDVKESLPLLMQERWYQTTRHGYARGIEAVQYVENIRSYYDILVWHDERAKRQASAVIQASLPTAPSHYNLTSPVF